MCQIAKDAKDIIEANVVDPLSVDELASVFGINRCTLARKFKRHHGHSIQSYQLELSRKRIMRWVDTTNLSGNQIAIRLGTTIRLLFDWALLSRQSITRLRVQRECHLWIIANNYREQVQMLNEIKRGG